MKIRTKLQFIAVVPIAIALVIGLLTAVSSSSVRDSHKKLQKIEKIVLELSELNALTYDYVRHYEERAKAQWQLKHRTLAARIADATFENPERKIIHKRVFDNHEKAGALFSQIVAIHDRKASEGRPHAVFHEAEDRLAAQLSVKLQSIISDALALAESRQADAVELQKRANLLIIGMIALMTVAATSGSFFLIRYIVAPIQRLHRATQVLAEGNLFHRVEISSDDEIGTLGRAFNEMAASLKQALAVKEEEIAERKRTEGALRESTETLRTLVETSPLSIIVTDPQGHVTLWNSAAEVTFGWRANEVIGKQNPIIPPDKHDEVRQVRQQVMVGKSYVDFETERVRKDGGRLAVSFSTTALRNVEGQVDGILAMVADITERKQIEEELRRYRDQLEELVGSRTAQLETANKDLEAFAYSVSHDLRAPLRHIDGFVDLFQKSAASVLDDKGKRYLGIISDSAKQMGQLIDDLLAFSRMGRAEIQKTAVAVGKVVSEALKAVQGETTGRAIGFKIADLPEVQADPAMLRVVFTNLLSNAVKFTSPRERAEVEVGYLLQDREHVFFVRDNGVGFDMQYVDKLFGVFQRLHKADEFEGTGIGLATVRRIIHRSGGRTWAEGKQGEGATVYFSLPV